MSAEHQPERPGAAPAESAAEFPIIERVGIIGAGKLGTTLARAAVAAGYEVVVGSSGRRDSIALTLDVLAPGAVASTVEDIAEGADVIILAVPTHRFRELGSDLFDGKIVVDAMNYWPDSDGEDSELTSAEGGSSVFVQAHFRGARIVKSLNQLGYHQLDDCRRAPGARDRIAVAAFGEDTLAVRTVMGLIDRLGFDPVDGGALARGRVLEADGSPYAETFSAAELTKRLSSL
jgi:8-hydroxy-5-deazaflavin:NADPH oxidoreductase